MERRSGIKRTTDDIKNYRWNRCDFKAAQRFGISGSEGKTGQEQKNNCMLGIWVRDNAQGLGTVTFLNSDSRFGALGHGIHDTDTNALMEIRNGRVYETSIRSIQKGIDGNPGGIEGIIVYNRYNVLGKIDKNTDCGILERLTAQKTCFRTRIRWR